MFKALCTAASWNAAEANQINFSNPAEIGTLIIPPHLFYKTPKQNFLLIKMNLSKLNPWPIFFYGCLHTYTKLSH